MCFTEFVCALLVMLVSVQVCSGVKVIRNWGALGNVFRGICTGQLGSPDSFCLEEQYADCPVSCSIASTQVGKFQSIFLCVSVQDTVEFGQYLKFVVRYRTLGPTFRISSYLIQCFICYTVLHMLYSASYLIQCFCF